MRAHGFAASGRLGGGAGTALEELGITPETLGRKRAAWLKELLRRGEAARAGAALDALLSAGEASAYHCNVVLRGLAATPDALRLLRRMVEAGLHTDQRTVKILLAQVRARARARAPAPAPATRDRDRARQRQRQRRREAGAALARA